MFRPFSIVLFAGLLSGALYLRLALYADGEPQLVEIIGLYLAASPLYILACFLALQISPHQPGWGRRGRLLIYGGALTFRLLVWPMFPVLSDDIYRYRWEGKLQAAGGNPYTARPADARWLPLRDETYPRVVGKEVRSGYGPLTELVEWGAWELISCWESRPPRQVFWFKLPFALADLGVLAALALLLRVRSLPAERVLVWAWCPLPILEFWATGHNDSLAILFVTLALTLAACRRWGGAFASLGAGIASKLWPLLLLPLFLGWDGRRFLRWRQVPLAAAVFLLCALPYWTDVRENIAFMTGFLSGWRNNDALFPLVLWLAGDALAAKRLALAIVVVAALWVTFRRWPLEHACLAVILTLLLVSANCHVWYVTWLIPLLAFVPLPELFLWAGLMPLAHRAVINWLLLGQWEGSTSWRWLIHAPLLAWLALRAILTIRNAAPRRDPASPPSPPAAARSAAPPTPE